MAQTTSLMVGTEVGISLALLLSLVDESGYESFAGLRVGQSLAAGCGECWNRLAASFFILALCFTPTPRG